MARTDTKMTGGAVHEPDMLQVRVTGHPTGC
jgi:hypothetical protein